MYLSGKQALVDVCPELYGNLETEFRLKNRLTQQHGLVIKEPHQFNYGWEHEVEMNRLLQDASANETWLPTILEASPERIVMEDVGGRTLGIGFDPEGKALAETDRSLASDLSGLTEAITGVLGDEGILVHGDYSPNNIRKTESGLVVLDFEKSRVAGTSERYRNAAQLITRLWFNRPLMNRLFDLQSAGCEDEGLFCSTMFSEISRKISFGVQHYPEDSIAHPVEIGRMMIGNLVEIETRLSF